MERKSFTQKEYQIASKVNLLDYVTEKYEVKKKGHEYCLKDNDSLVINPNNNTFYWHSQSTGGGILQFVQKYENKTIVEAVLELSSKENASFFTQQNNTNEQKKAYKPYVRKSLEMPEKNNTMKHIYAYLIKTRKIDSEIIGKLVKEKKLYEDEKHNCVFVGYDNDNKPAYASKRSSSSKFTYRGDATGSNKSVPFIIQENKDTDKVYVFESPIDAMSYATIVKQLDKPIDGTLLSLGGVSSKSLDYYLENNTQTKKVILCLDNDTAGQSAKNEMKIKYEEKGYIVKSDKCQEHKDWNEYLVAKVSEVEKKFEVEDKKEQQATTITQKENKYKSEIEL